MVVNLLFGLPEDSSNFSWFFDMEGKHIVCGGSTAQCVAKYLQKNLILGFHYEVSEVPPIAHLEGVDLVTEGIVTMTCVLEKFGSGTALGLDGASLICKFLNEAKEINFFVGRTENPNNKQFSQLKSKLEITENLATILRGLGKKVRVREV